MDTKNITKVEEEDKDFISINNKPPKIEEVKGIIYSVYCKNTEKYYIGQTISHQFVRKNKTWVSSGIKSRWTCHKREAKNMTNTPLYNDMRKHGYDNFVIEEVKIYEGKDIGDLDLYEKEYIEKFNSRIPNGYNKILCTSYIGISRKRVLDYYKIEQKEYKIYSQRKDRSMCKHIDKNTDTEKIFKKENIEKIKLFYEKSKNCIVVKFFLNNQKDRYRINFQNAKKTINDLLTKAIKYVSKFVDDISFIEMDEKVKDIMDKNCEEKLGIEFINEEKEEQFKDIVKEKINNQYDTIHYNKKLEEISKFDTVRINGKKSFHKTKNITVYLVYFINENNKSKKMSFGGKTTTIEKSYENAKTFVNTLCEIKNIETINLQPI